MSRYIDAKELRKAYRDWFDTYDWHHNGKDYEKTTIARAVQILDEQPTADVVEVVRCRDCTWWKSIFSWNGKEHKVCVRESAEPPRESDDYCSFGERREDERLNKQTGCD